MNQASEIHFNSSSRYINKLREGAAHFLQKHFLIAKTPTRFKNLGAYSMLNKFRSDLSEHFGQLHLNSRHDKGS